MDPFLLLRQSIQARGLRETSQREGVLRFLAQAKGHLTLEDIYEALRSRLSGIGRATVFRTVKLLEEIGLVSRVTFADGQARYEYAYGREHHDHMICVDCGKALEFSSPAIERLQTEAARARGFELRWHRHEMFGRCSVCSSKPVRRSVGVGGKG
ncbi:MAG: transcriptional repressor [Elusimicrobia bacterium]|nr:transcriptional repressor [Elusimicrobiota bacterium]